MTSVSGSSQSCRTVGTEEKTQVRLEAESCFGVGTGGERGGASVNHN